MEFIVTVQPESESHDVYTPVGQPKVYTIEAETAEAAGNLGARRAFDWLNEVDPTMWSPSAHVVSVEPVVAPAPVVSERDQRVARRYNLVYTRSIRHAVGQRVLLSAEELGAILSAAHRAAQDDYCPRCDGTGWTSFAPDGGCCYRCNPSGTRSRSA